MNKSKMHTGQKKQAILSCSAAGMIRMELGHTKKNRLTNTCHHSSSQDPKRQEKPNPYGNHGCGKFHTLVVQRPFFLRYGGIYL